MVGCAAPSRLLYMEVLCSAQKEAFFYAQEMAGALFKSTSRFITDAWISFGGTFVQPSTRRLPFLAFLPAYIHI